MKLHIGCGSVYLEGWLNVDVPGPTNHLAADRRDLVENYKTTDEDYYKHHARMDIDTLRSKPADKEYVCDAFGSFHSLPCGIGEADEILARQSFEHMSLSDAKIALDEIDRALKPGGILRIDVPDHEGTLGKFKETKDEFYIRHLLGTRTDDYGYHMMSYTKTGLQNLVEEFGFVLEQEEKNIHFYPAFCLRFRKPYKPLPKNYALRGIEFNPEWKILEIGPGEYPLKRADYYFDYSREILDSVDAPEERKIMGDLNNVLPFKDKEFDYVFCSHVFEHIENPIFTANEISRVAKAGTTVTPHAFKEFLFLFEEGDHKWWCFPSEVKNEIKMMPLDYQFRNKSSDSNVSSVLCRLFRTGPNRLDSDQRLLRKWFYQREKYLDVIIHWENEFKVKKI